jgi:hypothetical protein
MLSCTYEAVLLLVTTDKVIEMVVDDDTLEPIKTPLNISQKGSSSNDFCSVSSHYVYLVNIMLMRGFCFLYTGTICTEYFCGIASVFCTNEIGI